MICIIGSRWESVGEITGLEISDLVGVVDLAPLRSPRLKQKMQHTRAASTTRIGTTTAATIWPFESPLPLLVVAAIEFDVLEAVGEAVGEAVEEAVGALVDTLDDIGEDTTLSMKLCELVASVDLDEALIVTVIASWERLEGTSPERTMLELLYESQDADGLSETETDTSFGLRKTCLKSYRKGEPMVALALGNVLVNKV